MRPPTSQRPDSWLAEPRAWLGAFVAQRAADAKRRLGITWQVSSGAATYAQVAADFTKALVHGSPLQLPPAPNGPSIFLTGDGEESMRFLAYVMHIELGVDFSFHGRMRVAHEHLRLVEAAGQPATSLPWTLLRADTVGPCLVSAMTDGAAIPDRLAFARTALSTGLPFAVLSAVEEIEGRSIGLQDTSRLMDLMVEPS